MAWVIGLLVLNAALVLRAQHSLGSLRRTVDKQAETIVETRRDAQVIRLLTKQIQLAVLVQEHRIHRLEGLDDDGAEPVPAPAE